MIAGCASQSCPPSQRLPSLRPPRARSARCRPSRTRVARRSAATAFRVRTGDRLTLYAAVLGKGPTGIVPRRPALLHVLRMGARGEAARGARLPRPRLRLPEHRQLAERARFAGRENRPRRHCSGTRTAPTWLDADRPRRLADRGDRRAATPPPRSAPPVSAVVAIAPRIPPNPARYSRPQPRRRSRCRFSCSPGTWAALAVSRRRRSMTRS